MQLAIKRRAPRAVAFIVGAVAISYAYVMVMGFTAVNFPGGTVYKLLGPVAPFTVGWIAAVVVGGLVVLPLTTFILPKPLKAALVLSVLVVAYLILTSMSFRLSGVRAVAISDYIAIIVVFTLYGHLGSRLTRCCS